MPNLHIDFSILPKIQSFYFFNVIIVGFMKVNDLQTFYWNSGGVGLLYKKCQNLAWSVKKIRHQGEQRPPKIGEKKH